jgi:flagellar motor protein MotB
MRACHAAPNDTAQGRAMNRRVEVVFERRSLEL